MSRNYLDEIDKLHALREKGALSETEFEDAKGKLLEGVSAPDGLSDHSSLGGDGVGMPRADFGVRLLAALIDGLILLVPYLLVRFSFSSLIALAIFQLFGLVYGIGFWTTKGATPGKVAMGLRVVDMHGKKLNVWRAIARYLSLIVDGLTLGLGDLLIFGDQRLALHDRISGSQVVKDWPSPSKFRP